MRRQHVALVICAFITSFFFADVAQAVYHPTVGRWLTRDPIGHADSMNTYEYAIGEPTIEVDPSGESVSGDEDPHCLLDLAKEINGLIVQAVNYSHIAKAGAYDRGDGGRLTSLGHGSEVIEKWTFNAQFVSSLVLGQTGNASVSHGLIPVGWLHGDNYVRKPVNRCRGIGELIETNLEEAVHQKQQGPLNKPHTLVPAKEWKDVKYRDLGSFVGAITDDMSAVLHLDTQEKFGFPRGEGKCCCPRLLKMARDIIPREIRWHPVATGASGGVQ